MTCNCILLLYCKSSDLSWKRVGILGDPGADSGGEGKSERVGKYGTEKSKERREQPLAGDNVLPDQLQMVAAVLASDWCQKTFVFFCPIRGQNGSDRFELIW